MLTMIKRFIKYYKPYKFLFFSDFFCAIASSLLELVFPLAVNNIIDKLLPKKDIKLIIMACTLILCVYLLNTILKTIVEYWGGKLGSHIETDMRLELYTHLQKLSFRFFDNVKTGALVSKMTNELSGISEMAHYAPENFFIAIITLIASFVVMFYANSKLAIIMGIMISLLIILNIYYTRKMKKVVGSLFLAISDVYSNIEDGIGGIRVVQAFANEEYQRKIFNEDNNRIHEAKVKEAKVIAARNALHYILSKLVPLVALILGCYFILKDEMTTGQLFSFIIISRIMLNPVHLLAVFSVRFPLGIVGFKNFLELIDTVPDIKDSKDAINVGELKGEIRYKNVSFEYEKDKNVLKDINLDIKKGETVAFVGSSGEGKSTLCGLLPRFYDVNEGAITIDGIDIRQMTLNSLRKNIGIVQQDVFLFSGTIRENISFGKVGASDDEIWQATKYAKLDEFVSKQEKGLDTIIGERGVKLSGGQKQRISIARIFLKNPSILILDEATSSLDNVTEIEIQNALNMLSKGRTTLIIAHRLSTIKDADRILVVADHHIVEEGKHEELLLKKGIYYKLNQKDLKENFNAQK